MARLSKGVEVQYRFTNPGQSQQILTAQPASNGRARRQLHGGCPRRRPRRRRGGLCRPASECRRRGCSDGPHGWRDGSPWREGFSQTHAEDMPMTVGASSIYRGVTPDARDTLPHISPYQRAAENADDPNQLTWVGFQRFDDKARVFIQTGRHPRSTARRSLSRRPDHHHRASRHAGRHVESSPPARHVLLRDPGALGLHPAR